MPSFSIPLSGLTANSQALSAISNNLANLNTVGYKETNTQFRDLFYQQIGTSGSGAPVQLGAGVTVSSNNSLFTQGSVSSTGVDTNVAIQGNGFFVTQKNGLQEFTRAGDFTVDQKGILLSDDGGQVMGYSATGGVVNINAPVGPITLSKGQTTPANPTGNIQLGMNLDSSAAVGDTFTASSPVIDSLGSSHVLTFTFTKTAANTWSYNVTIPGADVGAAGPVSVKSGTLGFNGNGQLTAPAANITGINITGFVDGASNLTFNWTGFAPPTPSITQLAAASAVANSTQDGFPAGSLLHFTVDQNGVIDGTFSNGQSRAIGQIAVASFANDVGLENIGGNAFVATLASGTANIGAANQGGRGSLVGGALELSNVDIATQFAQLITAQRGYEANAKTVTTFDQVTQDTINIKQG